MVRSRALRHALARSVPAAPAWLPLAIDRMETSGHFCVDGDDGVSRGPELPSAIWLSLVLGFGGGLHQLTVARLGIGSVPPQLGALRALRTLDLSGNKLVGLPDGLANLGSLRHVDLSHNQLAAVPSSLWGWRALEALDVSYNALSELGRDCGVAVRLCQLDVSHNKLEWLPSEMGAMVRLRQLDISHNRLTQLPPPLLDLEGAALRTLHLHANRAPPASLILEGRLAGHCYVAVEFCTAPRPTASLKGDSAKYLACFGGVCRVVAMLFDGAIPVLANPGPEDTVVPYEAADGRRYNDTAHPSFPSLQPQPYPRLGAFEVVLRTAGGLFVPLHSKCAEQAFPAVEALARSLLASLGQPVEHAVLLHDTAQMHRVAATGELPPLRRLLHVASSFSHTPDAQGATPLWVAASKGHAAALAMLIRAGASPDRADVHGTSPLAAAAMHGHAACVQTLLRAGARVLCQERTATPLHLAVSSGCLEAVTLLLEAGSSRRAADGHGCTPLELITRGRRPLPAALAAKMRAVFARHGPSVDAAQVDSAPRGAACGLAGSVPATACDSTAADRFINQGTGARATAAPGGPAAPPAAAYTGSGSGAQADDGSTAREAVRHYAAEGGDGTASQTSVSTGPQQQQQQPQSVGRVLSASAAGWVSKQEPKPEEQVQSSAAQTAVKEYAKVRTSRGTAQGAATAKDAVEQYAKESTKEARVQQHLAAEKERRNVTPVSGQAMSISSFLDDVGLQQDVEQNEAF